jgi:rhodanese-related sulfurtransferase
MDITPEELYDRHQEGEPYKLIDVREPYEHEDFNIGGDLIPMGDILQALDKLSEFQSSEIVVYCRSGARSAAVREFMIQSGFSNVRNLTGGVLAWQEKFGTSQLD